MALPLKSGADLYNNQALRLRLHNLGADPTEVGAGLIYFNTSTGLNTSQKARLYTGSAWKTIAFSEDLDVAKNEDFLALQRKVDAFLDGGVDADNVLENLAEVQKFLDNYSGATSLSQILDTKLDKSGGTIESSAVSPLCIDTTHLSANYITFLSSGIAKAYVGWNPNLGAFLENETGDQLHIINGSAKLNGNTILTSAGGTIDGDIKINSIDGTPALIYFSVANSGRGALGCVAAGPVYYDVNDNGHDLLHSGNVGEYALNFNKKLDIQTSVNETGYAYTSDGWATSGAAITIGASSDYRMAFQGDYGSSFGARLQYNYCYGGEWKGWKTIAFTDSNVASAQALTHSNGTVGATVKSNGDIDFARSILSLGSIVKYDNANIAYFGSAQDGIGGSNNGALMYTYGSRSLYFYTAGTQRMLINPYGNVTIGATDLAGSDVKLHIADTRESSSYLLNARFFSPNLLAGGTSVIVFGKSESNKNRAYIGYTHNSDGSDSNAITFGFYGKDKIVNFLANGNVLIGTTEDKGAKLYVDGLTKAGSLELGNIITLNRGFNSGAVLDSTKSALKIETYPSYVGFNVYTSGGTARTNTLVLSDSGNVGIGTSNPTEKLHVVGNLHVTGNIIADGEVSAGGAGEEGSTSGSGAGAFHSESIAVGATQTTIAHGLGTDDIVVSIYEKDGVSGRWSIILTDVEIVDANNIIVSFGSATTVEHKVVIMGAVA